MGMRILIRNHDEKVLFVFLLAAAAAVIGVVGEEGRGGGADYLSAVPLTEPFPFLNSYNATGNPPQPLSPDPLIRYTWSTGTNLSQLQIYRAETDQLADYAIQPPSAVSGMESLLLSSVDSGDDSDLEEEDPQQHLNIVVHGKEEGSIMLDWGVERAAWFEFDSPDLESVLSMMDDTSSNTTAMVTASLSEYNEPYPGKTKGLAKYYNRNKKTGNTTTTFRLETNDELYEGVRFTWIHFPVTPRPWHITRLSLVAKVKPMNYTGSFSSSDDSLTQIWYTGAYGVRLNTEANGFNSVLVERGDRVSIQGDGHPTMAASHVAFATYDLVKSMLNQTNSGFVHGHHVVDEGILAYPIYWTMSVNDWYLASGDTKGFLELAQDVMSIIDQRVNEFLLPNNLVWMGWDDRLGDGWCYTPEKRTRGGCGREAHVTFAALLVRACHDLSVSLILAGMTTEGTHYEATARRLAQAFALTLHSFPHGTHAAANIFNAKALLALLSPTEKDDLFEQSLTDSVTVCSLSNFNQYWILQGMGNADRMEHALASIQLCWGTALKVGKGCFWENYAPDWASFLNDGDKAPIGVSYCHPWASGVTAWLSTEVGGVRPLLPGYETYVVAPYLSARYPQVNVTMPTPTGPISVTAQLSRSRNIGGDNSGLRRIASAVVTIRLEATNTNPGYIALRKRITGVTTATSDSCFLRGHGTVLLNNSPADVFSVDDIINSSSVTRREAVALLNHFSAAGLPKMVLLRIPSGGGVHTVSAVYSGVCQIETAKTIIATMNSKQVTSPLANIKTVGIPHFPPFPLPKYPASIALDRVSSGNGINKYGSDGYVLFGFQVNGADLANLPAYIKNVTVHRHGWSGWSDVPRIFVGKSTSNGTYLPDPRTSHAGERALGYVGQDPPHGGYGRGLIIDVEIDETNFFDTEFHAAVYCAAKSPSDKHAIRVEDLSTMNLVAPTELISNYSEGAWWSVKYHRSFRLRLMGIRGAHASAVVFGQSSTLYKEMKIDSTS